MLIRPPALTTKSGAQRTPLPASMSATRSSASWLFAAPAMIRQRSRGSVCSSSSPPSAHGARISTSASAARSGVTQRASSCSARRRRAGSTSETTSLAPARRHRAARREPTWPRPITHRPSAQRATREDPLAAGANRVLDAERRQRARVAGPAPAPCEPHDVARALRDHGHVPARGPDVLGGDVSPLERVDRLGEVEQRRVPPFRCSAPCEGVMITPLPPPSGRSATAAL